MGWRWGNAVMLDRAALKDLARLTGLRQTDLVPMAPANDPFLADQPARRSAAEWFARLFEQFGFGAGVHLRRIHYRIISAETPIAKPDGSAYENTDQSWKYLVNAGRDARYLGLVSADHFVDRRNPDPVICTPAGVAPATTLDDGELSIAGPLHGFPEAPGYRFETPRGWTPTGPYQVELWCEKTTMNDILLPLCRERCVNLVTGMGELSETATRLLVDRVMATGKPTRIFYLSDFDPAGRSMPLAVSRRVQFALHAASLEVDLRVIPLVLTERQCIALQLPRTPIKETELRAARFEARFGAGATELDALEALHPGKLRRIVDAAINRYSDPDYARIWHRAADEHRHRLRRWNDLLPAVFPELAGLKHRHEGLIEAWAAFERDARITFNAMHEWMRDNPPADFEPPQHRAADELPDEAVLFDSRRDYLSQADAYRAFKAGDDVDSLG